MESTYITYQLPVDPLALARHRHGKGRVWDSQKQEKLYYGILLSNAHGDRPLYTGALHIDINFYMKVPESAGKQKPSREGHWHVQVPDTSNCLKFLEDVGSGIIYADDRTICSVWPQKRWSAIPRIEFSVWELSNPAHQQLLQSAGRYRPSSEFLTNKKLITQEIEFLQQQLIRLKD